MNPSADRHRPTIAEIAALTRRLRELSAQGRDADPTEQAAFLAEKDALLARITDASPGPELHRHRAHLNRTDGPDVVFDPGDSQWWHPGGSARLELPHQDALPPWEQAARGADPAELAARAAALREQIGVRAADPAATAREGERPVSWCVVGAEDVEARREQLARWHGGAPIADQYDTDASIDGDTDAVGDPGWSR